MWLYPIPFYFIEENAKRTNSSKTLEERIKPKKLDGFEPIYTRPKLDNSKIKCECENIYKHRQIDQNWIQNRKLEIKNEKNFI